MRESKPRLVKPNNPNKSAEKGNFNQELNKCRKF